MPRPKLEGRRTLQTEYFKEEIIKKIETVLKKKLWVTDFRRFSNENKISLFITGQKKFIANLINMEAGKFTGEFLLETLETFDKE